MFLRHTLEDKVAAQLKRFKELKGEHDSLSHLMKNFLEDIEVSKEQVHALLDQPEQFTKEDWETLQKMKNEMQEKMKNLLESSKKSPSRKGPVVQPHWLWVK